LLAVGLTQFVQGGAAIVKGGATVGAAAAGIAAPQMAQRGGASGPMDDAVTGLQAQLTQRVAQTTARSAPGSSLVVPATGTPATTAPAASPAAAAPQSSGQASTADVRRATEQLDRQTMAAVATALMKGNTDNAKALLAANTSMSQAEIDQTLQGLQAQVDKAKADVQAAADAAARYTAAAMWVIFLSSLIALVAAAVGGWLGAGHVHRVHHLRRYETATARPL
jgi:cobalamin biosynthesis Mg chelatase CobN